MRKVVAYELLSLDGVAEDPSQFMADWDEVMDDNLGRVIATQDAVFLGRRTYDDWAEFWPNSDIEPFASFINGVDKYVVTSSVPEVTWAHTTTVNGGLLDVLADLKQQSGGDIGIHGSISLTQSLLESGLVDELRFVVAPALQGRGRRLFAEGAPRQLALIGSVISPSGSLLIDYRVGQNVPDTFRAGK